MNTTKADRLLADRLRQAREGAHPSPLPVSRRNVIQALPDPDAPVSPWVRRALEGTLPPKAR